MAASTVGSLCPPPRPKTPRFFPPGGRVAVQLPSLRSLVASPASLSRWARGRPTPPPAFSDAAAMVAVLAAAVVALALAALAAAAATAAPGVLVAPAAIAAAFAAAGRPGRDGNVRRRHHRHRHYHCVAALAAGPRTPLPPGQQEAGARLWSCPLKQLSRKR